MTPGRFLGINFLYLLIMGVWHLNSCPFRKVCKWEISPSGSGSMASWNSLRNTSSLTGTTGKRILLNPLRIYVVMVFAFTRNWAMNIYTTTTQLFPPFSEIMWKALRINVSIRKSTYIYKKISMDRHSMILRVIWNALGYFSIVLVCSFSKPHVVNALPLSPWKQDLIALHHIYGCIKSIRGCVARWVDEEQ